MNNTDGRREMNMLPYSQFEALRLSDFVRPSRDVEDVSDQEWLGGMWTGQVIGFTGFWALEDEPGRIARSGHQNLR